MPLKFANNARSTLLAGINASVLSFSVQSGHGARFPTLAAGDYCYVTIINASNAVEIVKVSARATDTFTIVTGGRGFDGTSAASWLAGDLVELRLPRKALLEFKKIGGQEDVISAAGTVNALTATLDTVNSALFDWFEVWVEPTGANTTTNPTLNLTLGSTASGAITIVRNGGSALEKGDMNANGLAHLRYDLTNNKWVLLNPLYPIAAGTVRVYGALDTAGVSPSSLGITSVVDVGTGKAGINITNAFAVAANPFGCVAQADQASEADTLQVQLRNTGNTASYAEFWVSRQSDGAVVDPNYTHVIGCGVIA